MPAKNELRLFLSSTFVDFQGERDFLAKKVFPGLRRMCRDRGVEFTEIDLRWGLTEDDTKKGRIIGTCLEEIDSCRPFFIGMLGDRYGWVPPIAELDKNIELRTSFPWLEAAIMGGQSVTELEFRHGFLNTARNGSPPLIYFRSPAEGSEEDSRIQNLKQEVGAYMGIIPVFTTPAELASLIEKDLTTLIEAHWPATTRTWLEEERAGHEAFAQSRRKGYIANPSMIDLLDASLDQEEPVLVVTGESGSGKSSLLSYWAESVRNKMKETGESDLFIIEHYIGVTAASTDPDTLMRRIAEEIKERIHTDDAVPASAAELEQSFLSWLGRITQGRLLILVDAINQLNTDGRFLSWLPEHVQSKIHWVISSTESEALDRLRDRARMLEHPLPEIRVEPITAHERRRVLRTFLSNYQKKLDPKQEEKIVRNKKSSSPLFLRTLLEELRIDGNHASLDHFIGHYLASANTPDLFSRILERIEQDYGVDDVRMLLTQIWAAPHGLSESEIIESSHLDRAGLSLLLYAFDYHLIRLQGRLSFFHDHLRQAVERRYLDTHSKKQEAWLQLAGYFERSEPSALKALSIPWLCNKANAWELLRQSLLDIDLVPYFTEGNRSYELLSYWNIWEHQRELSSMSDEQNTLPDSTRWNLDVAADYERAIAQYSPKLDAATECHIRYSLGLFFRNAGWHEGAATSARAALALCETLPESEATVAMKLDICLELGKAYLDRADLKNASETLEKALMILGDDLVAKNGNTAITGLQHLNIRNEYARLLKDQGKYAEAEIISRATLSAATVQFGEAHSTSQNEMRQLAEIMTLEGKFDEAESLHRAVLKSVETSLGPESLDVAYYLNQFAVFFRIKNTRTLVSSQTNSHPAAIEDYEEAQNILERAVAIIETRLGLYHPDLGQLLNNYAGLHSENGNWEKAEKLFERSLAIDEKAKGADHPNTALSLNNYAVFLYMLGRYEQAEKPFVRALEIRRKAFGENHPETAESYYNLANLRRRREQYEEAEKYYKLALKIRLDTLGPLHTATARTLEAYGRLKHILGELDLTEDLLRRAYVARKTSIGPEHHDTILVAIELAEVLLEQSKLVESQRVADDILLTVGSADNLFSDLRQNFDDLIQRLEMRMAEATIS